MRGPYSSGAAMTGKGALEKAGSGAVWNVRPPSMPSSTSAPWCPEPAAKQTPAEGQEFAVRSKGPLARVRHVRPPSVLRRRSSPLGVLKAPSQRSRLAQARAGAGRTGCPPRRRRRWALRECARRPASARRRSFEGRRPPGRSRGAAAWRRRQRRPTSSDTHLRRIVTRHSRRGRPRSSKAVTSSSSNPTARRSTRGRSKKWTTKPPFS